MPASSGDQAGNEREVAMAQGQWAGERRADPRFVDVDRGVVAHHRLIGLGHVLLALELFVSNVEPGVEARSRQRLLAWAILALKASSL